MDNPSSDKEILCIVQDPAPDCGSWYVYRDGTFCHSGSPDEYCEWKLEEIHGETFFLYRDWDQYATLNEQVWRCDCRSKNYFPSESIRALDAVLIEAILLAQAMIDMVET